MSHIDRRGSASNPANGSHCKETASESGISALRICQDVQHMIDINSEHLERLRTPMAATSELTKQEVRTLEGKLIKHFSKQLATRAALTPVQAATVPEISRFPSLAQWLTVVGITKDSSDIIQSRVTTLESLKDKTDSELNRLLLQAPRLTTTQRHEDLRRLSKALQNLRKYTDVLLHGAMRAGLQDANKMELHWDSWDHIPRPDSPSKRDKMEASTPVNVTGSGRIMPPRADSTSASSPSSTGSAPPPSPSPGITLSPPSWPPVPKATPPPTPPWSSVFIKHSAKFPATPPPNKKHSTGIQSSQTVKSDYPLTKSKSHESELGNRLHPVTGSSQMTFPPPAAEQPAAAKPSEDGSEKDHKHLQTLAIRRTRPQNESVVPADEVYITEVGGPSPIPSPKSPPNHFDTLEATGGPMAHSTLQVPKSPRTPRSMGHLIRHRFTKTFKPARCDLCTEYMFNGLKCKECKFKCHRDCEPQVPPSCGLPEDLVKYYMNHMYKEGSPIMPRFTYSNPAMSGYMGGVSHTGSMAGGSDHSFSFTRIATNPSLIIPAYPDSSSNTSSCNSSTPSSPAVMVTSGGPTPPHSACIYQNARTKFPFPDPPITLKLQQDSKPQLQLQLQQNYQSNSPKVSSPNPIIDSVKSYDSDKTLSGASGSSGSAGTAYRLDSQDSVDDSSNSWLATRQTSISLREWDIPYEELNIGDKIGSGRFSTVHQGNWHGDVAIKILDMENMEDEATLEAFRLDVATFRKTRHENLILFMGACMNPPKLAIVTSLCKGNTLYTHLHLRRDKFSMSKLIVIAQQICQGMGYLHHRGIVHKDLKTKNIFLENGRAIITDFGLVNVARRLCARQNRAPFYGSMVATERECMSIPKGWLCYLSPEIMRSLRVHTDEGEDLPFTKASDVYAFGTVWYEMLTGEWPWKAQAPETIIWLVGRGMKPSLANLQASRDVKDILVMCWTFKPEHRPDFPHLSTALEKIPKKRLARSPSHPVHLSRSAESVF